MADGFQFHANGAGSAEVSAAIGQLHWAAFVKLETGEMRERTATWKR